MLRFFKSLYLNTRFYYGIGILTLLFFISNFWNGIYSITWYLCIVFGLLLIIDLMQLYIGGAKIDAQRILKQQLSNGDENPIYIQLRNLSNLKLFVTIIDEIPVVFQKRDFSMTTELKAGENTQLSYSLFPVKRGEYHFGKLNVYTSTYLGFFARRYSFDNEQGCKVYPSYLQMQRYDFLAFQHRITGFGFKKIRRIGHTLEFEQIKEYVLGDDVRTINWKSTAKHRKLMVNQYQDEREQPIYCLIDTSRNMKMAFKEMRLLDYAINTCLAFSNVAIRKKDKAGLILFADKV
ncbi:MAG: DUF58 domain-containing protein, partial [Flavobacteriaceae bacterium]|nr:DUF58 domain-containing protein [Flavobacteriaceae bacterium]